MTTAIDMDEDWGCLGHVPVPAPPRTDVGGALKAAARTVRLEGLVSAGWPTSRPEPQWLIDPREAGRK